MSASTIKIPQVLTAALAAGVYICLAQRIGNYVVADGYRADGRIQTADLAIGFLAALVISAWNAKNFIDDYKAFEHEPDPAFHLGQTVFFAAASYTALAVAASLVFDGVKPIWGLVAFFLVDSIWSVASFVRRWKMRHEISGRHRMYRRLRWAWLYAMCALVLGVAAFVEPVGLALALWAVPVSVFVFDAADSRTFRSTNEAGA